LCGVSRAEGDAFTPGQLPTHLAGKSPSQVISPCREYAKPAAGGDEPQCRFRCEFTPVGNCSRPWAERWQPAVQIRHDS
jgi:hypothetical protein